MRLGVRTLCALLLITACASAFNIDLDAINTRLESEGLTLDDFNITEAQIENFSKNHDLDSPELVPEDKFDPLFPEDWDEEPLERDWDLDRIFTS